MLRLPYFTAQFPATTGEAIRLKVAHGPGSAYVAGGTDLYPNMKRGQQTPAAVVDIRRIPELQQLVQGSDDQLIIGAGVTLTRLIRDPLVRTHWPVLSRAAATISTPLLRNMGTVGGNLLLDTRCNYYDQSYEWRQAIDFCMKKDGAVCWVAPSSPRCWAVQSSDLSPVMVALGARVTLQGPEGSRTIPVEVLYRNDGIDHLTKHPDELLTAIEVPALRDAQADYVKVRRRGAFDFPVLGVAAWIRVGDGGSVRESRLVLGGVASHPIVSHEASAALDGLPLTVESIAAAAKAVARSAKPLDNTDFTIGWRKHMVSVSVRRALAALREGGWVDFPKLV